MHYHFKIHKEPNGYWAQGIELPGCQTQADTPDELTRNLQEALNLYLSEPEGSKLIFPLPKKQTPMRTIIRVSVDPRVAFACLLRRARLTRQMTQKQAAEKAGIKGLYSYQRLESGHTANPELDTLVKLKKAFPELKIDVALME